MSTTLEGIKLDDIKLHEKEINFDDMVKNMMSEMEQE